MSSMTASYQNLRSSKKFQKRFGIAWRLVVALILIFFSIFPVLWIISASFSSTQSLSTQTLIPPKVSMLNYERLFGLDPNYRFGDLIYQRWIFNSIKVASITSVLSLAITTMAAYAFSRMRFLLLGPLLSRIGSRKMSFFMARINRTDLAFLGDLLVAGKIVPVIERRYPLNDVAEAVRYLEEGHAKGKVVITVEHPHV